VEEQVSNCKEAVTNKFTVFTNSQEKVTFRRRVIILILVTLTFVSFSKLELACHSIRINKITYIAMWRRFRTKQPH